MIDKILLWLHGIVIEFANGLLTGFAVMGIILLIMGFAYQRKLLKSIDKNSRKEDRQEIMKIHNILFILLFGPIIITGLFNGLLPEIDLWDISRLIYAGVAIAGIGMMLFPQYTLEKIL
jgi:hypothetical protein